MGDVRASASLPADATFSCPKSYRMLISTIRSYRGPSQRLVKANREEENVETLWPKATREMREAVKAQPHLLEGHAREPQTLEERVKTQRDQQLDVVLVVVVQEARRAGPIAPDRPAAPSSISCPSPKAQEPAKPASRHSETPNCAAAAALRRRERAHAGSPGACRGCGACWTPR
eukprot:scaffold53_cov193-Pinguiococcus_pyrenoidosus.AAC.9